MSEYTLRMRAREVISNSTIAHTSYDLVIKNDDGSVEIRTVDLFQNSDGKIEFNLGQSNGQEYTLSNGQKLLWGDNTFYNEQTIPTTTDFLNNYHANAKDLLSDNDALKAFNKIVLDAKLRNTIGQLGGLLDYDYLGPNCNSWTKHVYDQYVNDKSENSLQDIVGEDLSYWGENADINSDNGVVDNAKAKLIDKVVDILSNPSQGVNLSEIKTDGIIWKKTGQDFAVLIDDGDSIFVIGSNGGLEYDKMGNVIKGIENSNLSLLDYQDLIKSLLGNPNHIISGLWDNLIVQKYISTTIATNWSKDYGSASEKRSPLILDLNGDGVKTIFSAFTRNKGCKTQSSVV